MGKNDERTAADIMQMVNDFKAKEDIYNELPKDKLVDRLIMCEMELAARDEEATAQTMELWYFVSDETGTKYLSNVKPKRFIAFGSGEKDEDGFPKISGKVALMTDGEVNIRVPLCMEKMFPEIKYGDDPVKVKVANITD